MIRQIRTRISLGALAAFMAEITLSARAGNAGASATNAAMGEQFARVACQLCHVFPEPDELDKRSWRNYVLPKMMLYMGLSSLDRVKVEDPDLVKASGIIPPGPMIPRAQWDAIAAYYLEKAPEMVLPQGPKPEVKVGLSQFRVEPPKHRRNPPLTTLVSIDEAERKIYTADAESQTLDILDATGALERSIEVGNIPVALKNTPRGLYLACIGHFFPSERQLGQVILLERMAQGFARKVILSGLPRVSDIEFGDINRDGQTDFVLCMFGYLTGRLSWFENQGEDRYREHPIFPKAGAMQAAVRDFNGDQALDIAALMGQEQDGVLLFTQDRKPGAVPGFTSRQLIRKSPSFGPDSFEWADFNGDGLQDLLLANGDSADYPQPPKRYHGVRIYLNKGGERFEEAFFYPLHGAYKALARDFDADGDLDIAAIAFFPDYVKKPMESFVYLENDGKMRFAASTFQQSLSGRWLTMDAGDVDGDGDVDLALGSLTEMPGSAVPEQLKQLWQSRGPSVLILRNTQRTRPASP